MAVTVISTDQVFLNYGSTRDVVLLEDVSVITNTFLAIGLQGPGSTLSAFGTIVGQELGVVLGTATSVPETSSLFVGATGSILSTGSGAPSAGDVAVLCSDNADITNLGLIAALGRESGDHAIRVGFDNVLTLDNVGTISAGAGSGVHVSGPLNDRGVATQRIDNSGRITGHDGISVDQDRLALDNNGEITGTNVGVRGQNGASLQIWNGGMISGSIYAVLSSSTGALNDRLVNAETGQILGALHLFDGVDRVINAGHVDGNVILGAGDDVVSNSGHVTGGLYGDAGADRVFNTGNVQGDVFLGNDDDLFDGRGGRVEGNIAAGTGNDTLRIDDATAAVFGGDGTDLLLTWASNVIADGIEEVRLMGGDPLAFDGGAGADSVIGNIGANWIKSGEGDDTVLGKGGDDELDGEEGADSMIGGAGDDLMLGGNGNDILRGRVGADLLGGGAGSDSLLGGEGDDTIEGGAGADFLYGEQGADVLVFGSAGDLDGDVVMGFQSGVDVIFLAGIGRGTFIGTSTFSGTGEMELRYRTAQTGHSVVQLDTDGDGLRDAQMVLRDVAHLEAGDFLL